MNYKYVYTSITFFQLRQIGLIFFLCVCYCENKVRIEKKIKEKLRCYIFLVRFVVYAVALREVNLFIYLLT